MGGKPEVLGSTRIRTLEYDHTPQCNGVGHLRRLHHDAFLRKHRRKHRLDRTLCIDRLWARSRHVALSCSPTTFHSLRPALRFYFSFLSP